MVESCELAMMDVRDREIRSAKIGEYVDLAVKHWEKFEPTKTQSECGRRCSECRAQLMKRLR